MGVVGHTHMSREADVGQSPRGTQGSSGDVDRGLCSAGKDWAGRASWVVWVGTGDGGCPQSRGTWPWVRAVGRSLKCQAPVKRAWWALCWSLCLRKLAIAQNPHHWLPLGAASGSDQQGPKCEVRNERRGLFPAGSMHPPPEVQGICCTAQLSPGVPVHCADLLSLSVEQAAGTAGLMKPRPDTAVTGCVCLCGKSEKPRGSRGSCMFYGSTGHPNVEPGAGHVYGAFMAPEAFGSIT